MKLQILVPVYNETIEEVKPLLDSIAIQQGISFDDVGVIMVCDGGSGLDMSLLPEYPFKIDYSMSNHEGVSATRNKCFDRSVADYVMFCDADDMFYNACGLYILFREIATGQFDTLVSVFTEESKHPLTGEKVFLNHEMDSTFVHGKVHRRQFLINNNIRWNKNLTIHEDSYFNCLCQKLSKETKYCTTPFYLWKWRDASVCRHDPKYILKTYNNMLESNTALVNELISRSMQKDAAVYSLSMCYDAYFTMNKAEWIDQENKEYRDNTEKRFKKYYEDFNKLHSSLSTEEKLAIVAGIRNRFYQEGLLNESVTFDDWIKHILAL